MSWIMHISCFNTVIVRCYPKLCLKQEVKRLLIAVGLFKVVKQIVKNCCQAVNE